jgi:hypothetical protein
LSVPDPNSFGGPVNLYRASTKTWENVELTRPYGENGRGLGVSDLAAALEEQRPARAGGALAFHVLDLMHAIHDASRDGRHVDIESTCDQPTPL